MIVKDQLNRKLLIKETPKRIISLVPSQTELLVDLGLIDSIVGITKFCIHPKDLRKQKPIVGGTKNVKIEKIKALNPDIIICNKEENSLEIIEALNKIAPIHISDIYNIEDTLSLISSYGKIFNVDEKASSLVYVIQEEREKFKLSFSSKSNKKVAYFIWKNPYMIAASNTFIDTMIKEAGFKNVFESEKRYPKISLDNLVLKQADIIMLSSEPYPFKEEHVKELKELFNHKEVIIVDGELFSWYGSRLIKSYKYFENLTLE